MLRLLAEHNDLLEADLSRYHHLRLTDLWRRDPDGVRLLTLREIWVRIRELPGDSRIVKHFNDGQPRWSTEAYLMADLVHVMSGKPHPSRPTGKRRTDEPTPGVESVQRRRARAEYAARKRAREQEQPAPTRG